MDRICDDLQAVQYARIENIKLKNSVSEAMAHLKLPSGNLAQHIVALDQDEVFYNYCIGQLAVIRCCPDKFHWRQYTGILGFLEDL